jgi:hypothetical protein
MRCKLSAFVHANILNTICILDKHGKASDPPIDLEAVITTCAGLPTGF